MSRTRWITYSKIARSTRGEVTITRPASEPAPKYYPNSRAATPIEIADEMKRREDRSQEAARLKAFHDRQDYKDATTIRNLLEWMTPDDHRLDSLTPEEWAELRERLER